MMNQAIFPGGDVGFEGSEPRRDSGDTFDEVLSRRIRRRSVLKGGALAPLFYFGSVANLKGQEASSGLTF